MRWPAIQAPLPLLGKELVEQAGRRRTYLLRVIYAVILFAIFCIIAYGELREPGYRVLGKGKEMFTALVVVQFIGILLFLPASMSAALTYEKERRSLELLLLTNLKPREILSQKFFGHLIPMFTFLLLALPPLALCYALGGITTDYLLDGIYVLFVTCLQVGALALMCSAFCGTSVGAFLASYLLLAGLYVLLPFLMILGNSRPDEELLAALVPLAAFLAGPSAKSGGVVARLILPILTAVLFLGLARRFLVRRAFLPPRNPLLGALRLLDRFFEEANKSFGNVLLVKEKQSLPDDAPVAWREVTRKSLGKTVYLFRLLVLLEVPILFLAAAILIMGPSTYRSVEGLIVMLCLVWVLAALSVCVMSANAIVSERTSQTLDVLLTTPLAGRDIVRQKLRGVRRLILLLLIPFGTLFVVKAWWSYTIGPPWWSSQPEEGWVLYLACSVATVLVFLPLVSWLSMWIGLKLRTRLRAILCALLILVGWNAVPPVALHLLGDGLRLHSLADRLGLLLLTSPAMFIAANEGGQLHTVLKVPGHHLALPVAVILIFLGYLIVLLVFRALCLRNADRYLGRSVAPGRPGVEPESAFRYAPGGEATRPEQDSASP